MAARTVCWTSRRSRLLSQLGPTMMATSDAKIVPTMRTSVSSMALALLLEMIAEPAARAF
jgi:hypothetical protein